MFEKWCNSKEAVKISVRQLIQEDYLEAKKLDVFPHQLANVHSIDEALSLVADSTQEEPIIPFGFFLNTQSLIGFCLFLYEIKCSDNYWISRFFIDSRYQGNGYGTLALRALLTYISTHYAECLKVQLCVSPHNALARKLYKKAGFIPTQHKIGDEDVFFRRMP